MKHDIPESDFAAQYRQHVRRKVFVVFALSGALIMAVILSLKVGACPLSAREVLLAAGGRGEASIRHVVWAIRLPRIVAAVVAGACLALAGAAMQNVLRNPLASPFTLGVSQGAAFGAAFAIIVLGAGNVFLDGSASSALCSPYVVVLSAFGGSLLTVLALVGLSVARDMSPAALILAGVALGSFFGAATMLLQYYASDIQLAAAVFWTFGDLGRAQWQQLGLMAAVMGAALVYFAARRWHFNAMLWGDDSAKSLGVNTGSLRLVTLVFASLMTSVSIAFLGIIGFVGLIAPHIVRMLTGQDYRFLLPCSALFGALLLLVSDVLARTVMAPVTLPVGILTSFAGVPLFLYLLLKNRDIRA